MAAARSSLPVPLSPRISTAEWVTATLRAMAIILRTAALEPLIVSKTPEATVIGPLRQRLGRGSLKRLSRSDPSRSRSARSRELILQNQDPPSAARRSSRPCRAAPDSGFRASAGYRPNASTRVATELKAPRNAISSSS